MGVGVDAGAARPAGDPFDVAPVAQAAGVVQHLADRDRDRVLGQFRHVLAHRVVERELAVAREQQHRGRGELLGDRARLEDRVGAVRHAVLEVRHAVGLLEHDAAVVRHPDGATGRLCVPRRELRIDGGFRHGWSSLRDGRNRRHQQPEEQRARQVHPAFPASACSFSVVARLRVVAWRPALPSSAAPALLFRIPSAKCR